MTGRLWSVYYSVAGSPQTPMWAVVAHVAFSPLCLIKVQSGRCVKAMKVRHCGFCIRWTPEDVMMHCKVIASTLLLGCQLVLQNDYSQLQGFF